MAGLVQSVQSAELASLPSLALQLEPYRRDAAAGLTELVATSPESSRDRVNASLMLVADDPRQLDYLFQRLLEAPPRDVLVFREMLRPHREPLTERLKSLLDSPQRDRGTRLRAACLLADYAPHDERWSHLAEEVCQSMITENRLMVGDWIEGFRPVERHLTAPLRPAVCGPQAAGRGGYCGGSPGRLCQRRAAAAR